MSPLLSLPTEILLHIIDEVLPPDLVNFCRCCKRLEEISVKALQHHQSMRTSLSNIFCGTHGDGPIFGSSQHPVTLLREILADDRYVYYPKNIEIGACGPHVFDEADPRVKSETLNAMKEIENEVVALVSKSAYLKNEDTVNEWIKAIASGDGRACAALAISLLPNLRSITLANFDVGDHQMIQMLGGIARASTGAPLAKLPALSKLSTVRILSFGREWDNFVLLELFAVLPSVRHLYGMMTEGENSVTTSGAWDFEPRNSGVTKMMFEMSSIAASSFAYLFSKLTAPQKFKYEAITPGIGLDFAFWEPDVIVALLLKYAINSLIELDLTLFDRNTTSLNSDCKEFVGYLRDFASLRHIRVDSVLFFRDSKVKCDWDDDEMSPGYEASTDDTYRDPPVPLVRMLPASVETLVLVGVISTRNAEKLFGGLPMLKTTFLPKLRTVTFESYGRWLDVKGIKNVCEECGIALHCSGIVH